MLLERENNRELSN